MQAKAVLLRHPGQAFHIPCIAVHAVERTDRTLGNRKVRVKYKIRVDLEARTEASTHWAGTLRRVKTKEARLEFGNLFVRVINTSIALAKYRYFIVVGVEQLYHAVCKLQRLFD